MAKKSKSSGTFKDAGLSKQIEALQGQIKTLSAPTAEEQGLSTQMGNITSSAALGTAQAQDPRLNPVALGFQTGQAAAISRQAEAATVPLRERLALMQQSRQTALSGAEKGLGFAQEYYAKKQAAFEKQQALKSAQKIAKLKSATDIQKSQISAASKKKTGIKTYKPNPIKNVTKKDPFGGTITGTFNPTTGEYKWNE